MHGYGFCGVCNGAWHFVENVYTLDDRIQLRELTLAERTWAVKWRMLGSPRSVPPRMIRTLTCRLFRKVRYVSAVKDDVVFTMEMPDWATDLHTLLHIMVWQKPVDDVTPYYFLPTGPDQHILHLQTATFKRAKATMLALLGV